MVTNSKVIKQHPHCLSLYFLQCTLLPLPRVLSWNKVTGNSAKNLSSSYIKTLRLWLTNDQRSVNKLSTVKASFSQQNDREELIRVWRLDKEASSGCYIRPSSWQTLAAAYSFVLGINV